MAVCIEDLYRSVYIVYLTDSLYTVAMPGEILSKEQLPI